MISDSDLTTLIDNLDMKLNGEIEKWQCVMDRRNDLISYNAKCCKPKVNAFLC